MMKGNFTRLLLLFFFTGFFWPQVFSQKYFSQRSSSRSHSERKKEINFNGQWKGGFDEGGYGIPGFDNDIDYVLELTTNGSQVSGYSYTYFREGLNKYYSICRLTGKLDRRTNEIVVTELERVKSNTPPDFQICYQTHRLHYERDTGNMEVLRGTWIPAPNQGRGCGSGNTVLSRRIINSAPVGFLPRNHTSEKKSIAKAPVTKPEPKKPAPKTAIAAAPKKHVNPKPPVHETDKSKRPELKLAETESVKNSASKLENTSTDSEINIHNHLIPSVKGFERRRTDVVKTIDIEQPTFRLDFYDNGVIDGDSITVFYNGKVVLSNQRLSDKPITLTLTIDKNAPENIVTMYADNLGTIPPNTALMVVTDGAKRYEVRMESDYGKSGSVIFRSKE